MVTCWATKIIVIKKNQYTILKKCTLFLVYRYKKNENRNCQWFDFNINDIKNKTNKK